ncbi:hypothetical protein SAMN02745157_2714 [Kaistia soli DSM 19436]|uniref:Uncharacterized protein n=1 Tax=Kaistia soli DSM 19436 TaxID=1122133 RepID=A0A1M5DK71_9HYPH|nr:hypothetical protein SAMN02745157_2714 [Kaistia soli DSM 19436]
MLWEAGLGPNWAGHPPSGLCFPSEHAVWAARATSPTCRNAATIPHIGSFLWYDCTDGRRAIGGTAALEFVVSRLPLCCCLSSVGCATGGAVAWPCPVDAA